MQHIESQNRGRYIPGSVPIVNQIKVYSADEIRALGGVNTWLKSIGSDKSKKLPEINFSEEEWKQMLNEEI